MTKLAVIFLLGGQVGTYESAHVNDVITILAGATRVVSRTVTVGAEAETNETLGFDTDIVFIISFIIPLLDVMTSLELHTVSAEEAIILLIVSAIQLTSTLEQGASDVGICLDVTVLLVDNMAGLGNTAVNRNKGGKERDHHGGNLQYYYYWLLAYTNPSEILLGDCCYMLACRRQSCEGW